MAPFGLHFGKKKKKNTGPITAHEIIHHEDPHGDLQPYALDNGQSALYGYSQVPMPTQGPPKRKGWRGVLRRNQPPQPMESIIPIHDRAFVESEYDHQHPLTISGPHTTGPHATPAPTVLPPIHTGSGMHGYEPTVRASPISHHQSHVHGHTRSHSSGSSTSSEDRRAKSHLARHNTGQSQAHTILPRDSASNVHIEYAPPHTAIRPLQGIVEEQSDLDYSHSSQRHHAPSVIQPMTTGQQTIIQQPTGTIVDSHPIGHGMHIHHRRRDGSTSTVPHMEVTDAHGVRQKVQEVLLDGSGTQEIPMPADGNVIFIVEEGVTLDVRTHLFLNFLQELTFSKVKDPDTGEFIPLEEYYARLAAKRAAQPPQERFIVVNGDASNIIVEDSEGRLLHRSGSSRSSRSRRSSSGPERGIHASELETTPEPSVLGKHDFNHEGGARQWGAGGIDVPPTTVYLTSIPEASREFLPMHKHGSIRSGSHVSTPSKHSIQVPDNRSVSGSAVVIPVGTPSRHGSAMPSPVASMSSKPITPVTPIATGQQSMVSSRHASFVNPSPTTARGSVAGGSFKSGTVPRSHPSSGSLGVSFKENPVIINPSASGSSPQSQNVLNIGTPQVQETVLDSRTGSIRSAASPAQASVVIPPEGSVVVPSTPDVQSVQIQPSPIVRPGSVNSWRSGVAPAFPVPSVPASRTGSIRSRSHSRHGSMNSAHRPLQQGFDELSRALSPIAASHPTSPHIIAADGQPMAIPDLGTVVEGAQESVQMPVPMVPVSLDPEPVPDVPDVQSISQRLSKHSSLVSKAPSVVSKAPSIASKASKRSKRSMFQTEEIPPPLPGTVPGTPQVPSIGGNWEAFGGAAGNLSPLEGAATPSVVTPLSERPPPSAVGSITGRQSSKGSARTPISPAGHNPYSYSPPQAQTQLGSRVASPASHQMNLGQSQHGSPMAFPEPMGMPNVELVSKAGTPVPGTPSVAGIPVIPQSPMRAPSITGSIGGQSGHSRRPSLMDRIRGGFGSSRVPSPTRSGSIDRVDAGMPSPAPVVPTTPGSPLYNPNDLVVNSPGLGFTNLDSASTHYPEPNGQFQFQDDPYAYPMPPQGMPYASPPRVPILTFTSPTTVEGSHPVSPAQSRMMTGSARPSPMIIPGGFGDPMSEEVPEGAAPMLMESGPVSASPSVNVEGISVKRDSGGIAAVVSVTASPVADPEPLPTMSGKRGGKNVKDEDGPGKGKKGGKGAKGKKR
ncbi:hypothetical protein FRB99_000714 [Tulasnella sp. 403]|nr:hypothetical protein FRB99_000714 [Tulasnella sp. 403]